MVKKYKIKGYCPACEKILKNNAINKIRQCKLCKHLHIGDSCEMNHLMFKKVKR